MAEIEVDNAGFYAVIPASVRYDKNICANAKLLYGEITALCSKKGFCWASNKYFLELYEVNERSVRKWISQLAENGYIAISFNYIDGTKGIRNRQISICDKFPTYGIKVPQGTEEKFPTPGEEKFPPILINNTSINNTREIRKHTKEKPTGDKPPEPPVCVSSSIITEYFNHLWSYYPKKVAKQSAIKTFEHKLRGLTAQEAKDTANSIYVRLKAFLEYWDSQNTELRYQPHFSTWLNAEVPDSPKYNKQNRRGCG